MGRSESVVDLVERSHVNVAYHGRGRSTSVYSSSAADSERIYDLAVPDVTLILEEQVFSSNLRSHSMVDIDPKQFSPANNDLQVDLEAPISRDVTLGKSDDLWSF